MLCVYFGVLLLQFHLNDLMQASRANVINSRLTVYWAAKAVRKINTSALIYEIAKSFGTWAAILRAYMLLRYSYYFIGSSNYVSNNAPSARKTKNQKQQQQHHHQ